MNKRYLSGEISTLVVLGAFAIVAVATFLSSSLSGSRQTTSTQAAQPTQSETVTQPMQAATEAGAVESYTLYTPVTAKLTTTSDIELLVCAPDFSNAPCLQL